MSARERTIFVLGIRRLLHDVAPLHAVAAALCLWNNSVASVLEAAYMSPALRNSGRRDRTTPRARRAQEDLDGFDDLAPLAADAIRALPARFAADTQRPSRGSAPRPASELAALAPREPHAFTSPSTPPVNAREAATASFRRARSFGGPVAPAQGVAELVNLLL